jgi:hypothetical protein
VEALLSLDPLGFDAGDPNLYRYVGNSPTNFTDPSGLVPHPLSVPTDPNAISSQRWDGLLLPVLRDRIDPKTPVGDIPFARYFEDAVIRMVGCTPYRRPRAGDGRYDSAERAAKPNGRSQVRPDAVGMIYHVPIVDPLAPRPRGKISYPHSFFIDAKRGDMIINLSSYNYEAVGYADVLGRSPAATSKPRYPGVVPVMLYITTSDTKISQEVVDLFTSKGVLVAQSWVAYDEKTCKLYLTPATILNPKLGKGPPDLIPPNKQFDVNWDLIKPFAD